MYQPKSKPNYRSHTKWKNKNLNVKNTDFTIDWYAKMPEKQSGEYIVIKAVAEETRKLQDEAKKVRIGNQY